MGQMVVGYDGSDCSKSALEKALTLAGELHDQVVLVFGYEPPGIWGGEIAEHEEAIEEFGEKMMEEGRARAASAGVEVDVELVPKRGPEALIEVAEQRDAHLIVVGSHGEAPLKGAILGSTPNKLLQAADRPVLVVPMGG
jgi:nucleotide-binding universal stress UspA family protein